MTIREASPADIPQIFAVRTSVRENRASPQELAEMGFTPHALRKMLGDAARAWVAEVESRIVGYAIAIPLHGSVFALYVRPDHEGRGIGKALLREAEAALFASGLDEIWLMTDGDAATRASGFYEHLGWLDGGVQEDGRRKYVRRRADAGAD